MLCESRRRARRAALRARPLPSPSREQKKKRVGAELDLDELTKLLGEGQSKELKYFSPPPPPRGLDLPAPTAYYATGASSCGALEANLPTISPQSPHNLPTISPQSPTSSCCLYSD